MTTTEIFNQLCRDRESSMRRILEAEPDGSFERAMDALDVGEGLAGDGAGQPLFSEDEPELVKAADLSVGKVERIRGIRI